MTVQPVATLLRQINKEPFNFLTVTGCQALHHEAVQRYDEINQQIKVVKSRIKILAEIADECRQDLQNWHTKPGCSRHNTKCRDGTCGCSYKSFVHLWSLLELQKTQADKRSELEHEASSYRYLADNVIIKRLNTVCNDKLHVIGFAEIMHLTGDIDNNEWDFISLYVDDISLHGPPYELRLTITTCDKSYEICWDESSNQIKG